MIRIRQADARGRANFGWLDARYSFSFANYHDPEFMGFGPLRVINEDRVAPGGGFDMHSHRNMEIITYVLDGALEHKDSLGTGSVIRPGEVQKMSAGSGIAHSEFNASKTDPVHLLQIWIEPNRSATKPSYAQKAFARSERQGRLRLVVSPDGADGSLAIVQYARIYATELAQGERVTHALGPGRRAWLQLARGRLEINGTPMSAGDGAAIESESLLTLEGVEDAEALLFDLP